MTDNTTTLVYNAPGPVGEGFLASRKSVQGIMGPIGSGKTSLCLMKNILLGQQQAASTIYRDQRTGQPLRRYKFCVVRDTYRQLWNTTLKSWWRWIPQSRGEFKGEKDGPATHLVRMPLADGTVLELIAEFVAIGEHKVEDVLRGYEPTAFYLNEADLLVPEVFYFARGRAGRYPGMNEGGPSWHGILLDFNAPDTDSWLYRDFFEKKPDEFDVFVQPSGFSPQAENVTNLPPGYYDAQSKGQPEWYVRRMIENQFGYSRDGQPIYPEFNDQRHVSRAELEPIRGLPLKIGGDGGGSPAAVFGQFLPNGQWRILRELVTEQGTGMTRFADLLSVTMREHFAGWPGDKIEAFGDPAAFYGGDKLTGEDNFFLTVNRKSGIRFRPAPSNKPGPRWESVRLPLVRTIDGTIPGLILDAVHCPVLRKGFNSMYRRRRLHLPGEARYADEAEKNAFSHPHDAVQYMMLGGGEYAEVQGRKRSDRDRARPSHAITEDDSDRRSGRGGYGRQTEALD